MAKFLGRQLLTYILTIFMPSEAWRKTGEIAALITNVTVTYMLRLRILVQKNEDVYCGY